MPTQRRKLIDSLQDREFREAYVAEHLHQGFAFQVKSTRKGRDLTQKGLADIAEMKQSRISQIEDPSNEGLTLTTAKRVASALDVALLLRLVPYSKFVEFLTGSTSVSMRDWTDPIPAFTNDSGIRDLDSPEGSVIFTLFTDPIPQHQAALPMYQGVTNIVPIRTPAYSSSGLVSSHMETLKVRVH